LTREVTGQSERRQQSRGSSPAVPSRAQLALMIIGAYRKMPGLALRASEAARLFALSPSTCRLVLDHLVTLGRLRVTDSGHYRLT
jgi:DNA-binding IclR family transcriptional regulator